VFTLAVVERNSGGVPQTKNGGKREKRVGKKKGRLRVMDKGTKALQRHFWGKKGGQGGKNGFPKGIQILIMVRLGFYERKESPG